MYKGTYRLFVVGLLCLLLTAGTIIGYKIGGKINKGDIEKDITPVNDPGVIESPVMSSSAEKKQEYIIIKKVEYELCEHTFSSEDVIVAASIDDALKEVDLSGYEVFSKGTNGAVLLKKEDGYCKDHYIITTNGKNVIVYRKISKDEKEVYINTDIPTNILRDDTLEDLKKGIEVDSIDELNKMIEELES